MRWSLLIEVMNKLLKSVNRDQKYRKNNKWRSYLFIKLFSSFFFLIYTSSYALETGKWSGRMRTDNGSATQAISALERRRAVVFPVASWRRRHLWRRTRDHRNGNDVVHKSASLSRWHAHTLIALWLPLAGDLPPARSATRNDPVAATVASSGDTAGTVEGILTPSR